MAKAAGRLTSELLLLELLEFSDGVSHIFGRVIQANGSHIDLKNVHLQRGYFPRTLLSTYPLDRVTVKPNSYV